MTRFSEAILGWPPFREMPLGWPLGGHAGKSGLVSPAACAYRRTDLQQLTVTRSPQKSPLTKFDSR